MTSNSHRTKDLIAEAKNVIKTLSKVSDMILVNEQLVISDEGYEKFLALAKVLSSLLPRITDPSVCEIDHLLFPTENLDVVDLSDSLPKVWRTSLLKSSLEHFYVILSFVRKTRYIPHILCVTYLQLLEHSDDSILKIHVNKQWLQDILNFLCKSSRNDFCEALKCLKVVFYGHSNILTETIHKNKALTLLRRLLRLSKVKHIQHPKMQRLTSWIAKQSEALLMRSLAEIRPKPLQNIKQFIPELHKTKYDANYINCVLKMSRFNSSKLLYFYFSSAENEEENTQRIKDLFGGLLLEDKSLQGKGEPTAADVVQLCEKLVVKTTRNLFVMCSDSDYPNLMKEIDKWHHNDMEPYLSETDSYSSTAEAEKDRKDFVDSLDDTDIFNFHFMKDLFYDEFLEYLYVLWKLHEACLKCEEVMMTKGDMWRYEGKIFRSRYNLFPSFISKKITNPSSSGETPWWIYILLKKCPFIIFSKDTEYLIGDLIRYLEGQKIETPVLESLYFALNSRLQKPFVNQ